MLNVLIIGAGSIGALKPDKHDSPTTEAILTHCHSVKEHPAFRLLGILDTDKEKVVEAVKKWQCTGYTNFNQINNPEIDVVVIATPTHTHLGIYNQIKDWDLKAIIIEKPCTDSLEECERLNGDDRIIVNYSRRFLNYYKYLKNVFGMQKVLSCIVHYVRGLKRDGCHAVDLCRYFFGKILSVKKLSAGPDDYSPDDTTDCIWMQAERCSNIVMIPSDGRIADCFDFHIMTEIGMIELLEHGGKVFYRPVRLEKEYGNYNVLDGRVESLEPTDLKFTKHLMPSLYDYVYEVANGCENNRSTVSDALRVHEIIEEVRR